MPAVDHIANATKLTAWREAALALLPPYPSSAALFKMREYLRVPNALMRKDVARLLAGISPCAIELSRHHQVPRDRRVCCFCLYRDVVEDEHRVLFACPEPVIQRARDEFYTTIMSKDPGIIYLRRRCGDWCMWYTFIILGTMLTDSTMVHAAAAFVSMVFEVRTPPPHRTATPRDRG
ncbi:hypothetical protein C8Q73DRAFT_645863 [Cubamyces lactineus]|nr:hypothetical protein C8Q73DRAFT_645863 [Cubamyces lactineus]